MARTFIGELILRLKDEMSGKAKEAASNLDTSVERIQKAAERMNKTTWGGSFEEKLRKLGASSGDIDKLRTSWENLNKSLADRDVSKAMQAMEKANFKNASLGVFAELAANADKAESSISRMHTSIKDAMKDMAVWSTTGALLYGGVEAFRGGVKANAEFQREQFLEKNASISEADRMKMLVEADRLTTKYPSAGLVNVLEMARTARGMMGDTERGLQILPDLVKGLVALQTSNTNPEFANDALGKLLRGIDNAGKNVAGPAGIKDTQEIIAGLIRASQIEGKEINVGDMWTFMRRAKIAGPGFSTEFIANVVPALIQDMGAPGAGTALSSDFQAYVIGSNAVASAKNIGYQKEIGIRTDDGLVNAKLMANNPYRWATEVLLPALEKHGVDVNDNAALAEAIAKTSRNTPATAMLTKMLQQRNQIDRTIEQYRNAIGPDSADVAAASDPFVSMKGFVESWRELATAVRGMPEAVAGLNTLTAGIQNFATALRNKDGWAQLGLAGAGAAGLVGAWKMMTGLWNLGTAGTSLQVAAVELQAAALSLKGASAANGPGNSNKPGTNTNLFGGIGPWGTLMNFAATAMEDIPSTIDEWAQNRKLVHDRDKRIDDWIERNIGTPRSWLGLDDKRIGSQYGGYDMARRAAYANSPAGIAEAAVNRALVDKANHHSTTEAKADDRLVNPYQSALEYMDRRQEMESLTNPEKGLDLKHEIAAIIYELMKPTRDKLFAEIPADKGKQQADQTTTAAVPPTVDLQAVAGEEDRRREQMRDLTMPYNPNTPNVSQYFEQPAAEQKPVVIEHQPADARTVAGYQQNADTRQAAGISSNPQVKPDVDMSAISAAEAEAARIGQGIVQALAVTGSPQVDLAALRQALALANQLRAALSGIGSAVQNAHQSVAREMNRNFSDHGVTP